jgi:hypothetical protein
MRLELEVPRDLVGHVDQLGFGLPAHSAGSIALPAMRRAWRACAA